MGFGSLWPLALLVLVPIIILLYILKQEAKQQSFSSTMLWQEVYRNMEATKPWEKLKKNLLMILQIITILLFIAALMGPWLKSLGNPVSQVVLVLDTSASMDTLYEGEKTRLQAAKEAACSYVDDLPGGTLIHVISCDQQASLVLSSSKDKTEAKSRIRSLKQTSFAGDLSTSLGLVQSCASQSEDSQVAFFTDTAFDKGDLNASVVSFYREQVNLSVDAVSYVQKDDSYFVLVQVTNYSEQAQTREINLYGEDAQGEETLLELSSVQIPAGESQSVYLELDADGPIAEMQVLRAELNEADALAGDNISWCVLQETRENRVLLVTESNLFVEKAFQNLEGVELYRTSDPKLTEDAEQYDLYIFDGIVPEKLPESGSFLFINCDYPDYFANCGKVEGKMLTFVDNEVTSYIAGDTFGVNQAFLYQVPNWGTSFLQVGKGSDSAGFYGIYDGRRIAAVGFDLHQTDLGLQAEFPVLISGLSDYLLNTGLTDKIAYTVGDSILLHGSTRGSDMKLLNPEGKAQTMEVSEAAGSYLQLTKPGVYEISQEQNEVWKQQKFFASFPSVLESSVESAQTMMEDSEDGVEIQTRAGALEMRNYILVLLLLLILGEWIVYIRMQ